METIKADMKGEGKELKHFWNTCVGAGRANEGLRAAWQEQLKDGVENCRFEYIRFHGLFHDDMFLFKLEEGKPVYNFQYIDELFDRLLDTGIRPFVELGFCPRDMASGEGTVFWWKSNISPPKDYDLWAGLIHEAVTHWIGRYGEEEVRRWYFEVWNEPNLRPFWNGTKQQYFELYKITAQTIKAIDPRLRVGGPATSNYVPDERFHGETEDVSKQRTFQEQNDLDSLSWEPVWIRDFIDYCHGESLPVDFISTHPYPTDTALDGYGNNQGFSRGIDATKHDLELIRSIVRDSPYGDAEIHLTEWNASSSSRDNSHDYLTNAAFIVKTNIDSTGLVDSLSYWTFTDVFEEGGAGDTIFHGGFGMINYQGIVKPAYHAYRFLSLLGDRELARTEGCIVTKHSENGGLSLLGYNYPADEVPQSVPRSMGKDRKTAREVQSKGKDRTLRLALSGLEPGASFLVETLDKENGFALGAWDKIGNPPRPTREQTAFMKEEARRTKKEIIQADGKGEVNRELTIAPWSLVSIRTLSSRSS